MIGCKHELSYKAWLKIKTKTKTLFPNHFTLFLNQLNVDNENITYKKPRHIRHFRSGQLWNSVNFCYHGGPNLTFKYLH